jgi:hypothetical protein
MLSFGRGDCNSMPHTAVGLRITEFVLRNVPLIHVPRYSTFWARRRHGAETTPLSHAVRTQRSQPLGPPPLLADGFLMSVPAIKCAILSGQEYYPVLIAHRSRIHR